MYGETGGIVEQVDSTFAFIMGISAVLLLGITATMIVFVIKYSRKRNPEPTQVQGSTLLEVTWTVIPTILVLSMFYYGYQGFALMRDVPEGALEVKVTARMWDWSFEYDNGTKADKLYVPVGRPIKLLLNSVDVLHSFYLPSFRVKEDAVPGQETYLWFKPQTTGPADIFCAEYCGQRHAYMLSQVVVMEQDEFQAFYESKGDAATLGEEAVTLKLFDAHGCMECHSFDVDVGGLMPLRGIIGRETVVITDGKEKKFVADEAYLRRSIRDAESELVKGYDADMPAFADDELSDADLDKIVEYLKALK